jgi:hypothetical protein
MTNVDLKLALPDALAREAKSAGLLTPDALETLLREAVRRRRVNQLARAMNRLSALDLPVLTDEEVEAEIAAARAERRAPHAGRR